MELSVQDVRSMLLQVDVLGWESPAGSALVHVLRNRIARPAARAAGLTGPAAAQAEASAWAAAWDALRRPAARTAENPMGMAWVAARRAVHAEMRAARPGGPASEGHWLPLELAGELVDPADDSEPLAADHLGRSLDALVDALVLAGWDRPRVIEAITLLADQVEPCRLGTPVLRWRWVALRLGLPEWQVRRLAVLLVGAPAAPGVLVRLREGGPAALRDPIVLAAVMSTTRRWSTAPHQVLVEHRQQACSA